MFYELAQLSVRNLMRARARLAMTAGGVLVGTAAVILLIALSFGLQRAAEAGIGSSGSLTELNVWPGYPGGNGMPDLSFEPPQLDVAAVSNFWQIEGIAAVIPMVNLQGGQLETEEGYTGYAQILGIDPQLLPYLGITVDQGTLSLGPGEVLVGSYVGQQFYDPNADPEEGYQQIVVDMIAEPIKLLLFQGFGIGDTEEVDLTVAGVLTPGNNNYDGAILMPINDVVEHNLWMTATEFDPDTFRFDQIIVRTEDREVTNQVSDAIRDLGFQTGGMGDFLNQLNNFFSTMRLALGGVGGVALLVAAFGVANTMTMAILERTKEIGLMKAIGATDQEVLTVFLIEAGLVGTVGGVSGVAVAYFVQNLVNTALLNAPQGEQSGMMFLPIDPTQLNGNLFVIPPELALFAVVLATMVGLGAGMFPALRAARLPPVIALKSE